MSEPKPKPGPEQITISELVRRCEAQRVEGSRNYAFKCPICGTVQSMASLVAAGVEREQAMKSVGFACEGRFTGVGPYSDTQKGRSVRGCDWSLGGLFRLHNLEITYPDEPGREPRPCFEIATPKEARALAKTLATHPPSPANREAGR